MTIEIRPYRAADEPAVETLIRDAFWDVYRPGCTEHLIFHRLVRSPAAISELNLVAAEGETIVGQVIATRAGIDGQWPVLCVGPVGVAPDRQRSGIGSALMEVVIGRAREMGERALVLYGDPDYYGRFGFVDAKGFGVTTADGTNPAAFQVLPLRSGALEDVRGAFAEAPEFTVTDAEVADFDRGFPPREKHVLPGQLFD